MRKTRHQLSSNFVAAQFPIEGNIRDDLHISPKEKKVLGQVFQDAIGRQPTPGCLAPIGQGKTCGKNAIKSHTLGLARELRAVANEEGMVKGAKIKLSAIFDFGGEVFEDMSIKQASIFPGFCHKHDTEIFAPIDEQTWNNSDHHKFLLAYRSLCREVYAKMTNVESFMPALLKHSPLAATEPLRLWNAGEKLGMRESFRDKKLMDEKLTEEDFQCETHVMSLGADFPLRVSGVFVPEFDYFERKLYDLKDYSTPAHRICVSTHTVDNDVLGVFTAFRQEPMLTQYLDSLRTATQDSPRAHFAQVCFDNFEHIYFNIKWWESLRERHRVGLQSRFEISGPGNRPHGTELDPMFNFI